MTSSGFVEDTIRKSADGWSVLLWGWLALLDGTIAWYANLFLIASLVSLKKKNALRALKFTILGLMIGFTSFFYTSMWGGPGDSRSPIVAYDIGVYLWLSSFVLVFSHALMVNIDNRSETAAESGTGQIGELDRLT